jgi:NADH-quinone oxidoreductase subunit E
MSTAENHPLLTPGDVHALDEVISRHEDKRAACIEAMRLVQQRYGWISDERLSELASKLDMTRSELDGVATFYNLVFRRAVGRHVIMLCDSVSCWLMGYQDVAAFLQERLGIRPGETTSDGRFTLLPIVCLGHCDHAPAMMIGNDLHGDLDRDRLASLLNAYD